MLELIKTEFSLQLVPTDKDALADAPTIEDALEGFLCNGWEIIRPEDIGALTSGMIISDDVTRDDDSDQITKLGRVYWDDQYAIIDALAELQAGRTVEFVARD